MTREKTTERFNFGFVQNQLICEQDSVGRNKPVCTNQDQAADQVQKDSEKLGRQLSEYRTKLAESWFQKLLTSASDKAVWKPVLRSFS